MRKFLIVGAGVALVGAGLWAGGWYVGRAAVEERIDAAEANLSTQGYALSYVERSIGGFPTGYDVKLTDVGVTELATGRLLQLPEVNAAQDPSDGTVLVSLPDTFTLTLPVSEAQRLANPTLPAAIEVKGSGQKVVARVDPATPNSTPQLSADQLTLSIDQEDMAQKLSVSAQSLSVGQPETGGIGVAAGNVSVEASKPSDGAEPAVTAVMGGRDLLVRFAADIPDGSSIREVIYAAAPGIVELSYEVDGFTVEGTVSEDPLRMNGDAVGAADRAEAVATFTGGLVDVTGKSQGAKWTWIGEAAPFGPLTVSTADAAFDFVGPISPTQNPIAAKLLVSLDGVETDDAVWSTLDPSGSLSRDPANLLVDIDATMRLMARIDLLPGNIAPPFEISNVSLNTVELAALGATAKASGDIEIVQPVVVPTGKIAIEAVGLSALGQSLFDAGLINGELLLAWEAILQVYAQPGVVEDTWTSELSIGLEGLWMNGTPIQ